MQIFDFLLTNNQNPTSGLLGFGIIIIVMVVMLVFSSKSRKKQEQQEAQMRDSLAVGDEVTTIGGIIGKVVSIKDETFVLETTRDKTKIRFLKGAIRSIDVKAADIAAAILAEENAANEASDANESVEKVTVKDESSDKASEKKSKKK